jgi:hypothetical protein
MIPKECKRLAEVEGTLRQKHAFLVCGTHSGCGPDFVRVANALSELYPTVNEEKRLLDAMLLACMKR